MEEERKKIRELFNEIYENLMKYKKASRIIPEPTLDAEGKVIRPQYDANDLIGVFIQRRRSVEGALDYILGDEAKFAMTAAEREHIMTQMESLAAQIKEKVDTFLAENIAPVEGQFDVAIDPALKEFFDSFCTTHLIKPLNDIIQRGGGHADTATLPVVVEKVVKVVVDNPETKKENVKLKAKMKKIEGGSQGTVVSMISSIRNEMDKLREQIESIDADMQELQTQIMAEENPNKFIEGGDELRQMADMKSQLYEKYLGLHNKVDDLSQQLEELNREERSEGARFDISIFSSVSNKTIVGFFIIIMVSLMIFVFGDVYSRGKSSENPYPFLCEEAAPIVRPDRYYV
jgi:hypothetical protein